MPTERSGTGGDAGVPTLAFAAAIACLSWSGIAWEAAISFPWSFAQGRSVVGAALFFLRFFTNATSIGVATLMTTTAWRALRRRPLPPAEVYAAVLVYIAVVSCTYEVLLRHLWTPRGVQIVRDALMHDVVPALTLLFWLTCAPKAPLPWPGPLRWLAYPLTYFLVTMVAGAAGAGYPYAFLDPGILGTPGLIRNALAFTLVFYGLGLGVTALAGAMTRHRAGGRVTSAVG